MFTQYCITLYAQAGAKKGQLPKALKFRGPKCSKNIDDFYYVCTSTNSGSKIVVSTPKFLSQDPQLGSIEISIQDIVKYFIVALL